MVLANTDNLKTLLSVQMILHQLDLSMGHIVRKANRQPPTGPTLPLRKANRRKEFIMIFLFAVSTGT